MKHKSIYKSVEGKQAIINQYIKMMKLWPVPYKEIVIDTSYGKTYIIELGDKLKPAIILLHGSSTNSSMWVGDVEILSKEYHVISVDILGEPGKSDENRPDLNAQDYAIWMKEILDAMHIKETIIMGNSLGGWMALKFATTCPERITKLVLLATSGVTPAKGSFLVKALPLMLMGEKGLKGLNKIVYGTDDIPDKVMEVSNLIMKHYNPRVGSLPVFTDEALKKITKPVLFIGGENDALLPSAKTAARLKKLLPQAATKVIKNNGHVVFNVIDEIMEFLRTSVGG